MASVTLWSKNEVEARWNKAGLHTVETATTSRAYPNEGAAIAAAKRKAAKVAKQEGTQTMFKVEYRDLNATDSTWREWSRARYDSRAYAESFVRSAQVASARDSTAYAFRIMPA